MATATLARAPQTSVHIVDRRATCAGIQYSVEDELGMHTATVSDGRTSCTCGLENYSVHCPHRQLAETQEQAYAEEAFNRETYCNTFSIY
jgi:hypothetical protein